jgi:acetyl esterase
VAPLWADHKGLPPALVQVGELDPLRDENVEYAKALKAAGVDANAIVYPGQQHGFMQFYKDKEHNSAGDAAIETGIDFLKRVLPSS